MNTKDKGQIFLGTILLKNILERGYRHFKSVGNQNFIPYLKRIANPYTTNSDSPKTIAFFHRNNQYWRAGRDFRVAWK